MIPKKYMTILTPLMLLIGYLFGMNGNALVRDLNTFQEQTAALATTDGVGTDAQSVDDLYPVSKVVDGDTITIDMNGKKETLRLIGINTPESVDPRRPVQCFGEEAAVKAKSILEHQRVRIELDPSQGERDKYSRMLAYVFLADGTNFNQTMIAEGYAYEYTYNKPYKYQSEFKAAQVRAKAAGLGLWAKGICGESAPAVSQKESSTMVPEKLATTKRKTIAASPQVASLPSFTSTSTARTYVCNKNTYNCSDFTTHSEAQAVFLACGGAANDVHRLDIGDKDGLACESLSN